MDNLTHALTGAALAKAGLERHTPLATATLVFAANAPDVDMLAFAQGPYFALAFRRGITHGVPALLVLPFAVAGVVLAWDRWVRLRRHPGAAPARPLPVLALAFVGLLTHPALDWMNTYGMRWWLPFDGRWSYGDSLFILDPWLWLALGAAVWLSGSWSWKAHTAWGVLAAAIGALLAGAPVPAGAKALWGALLLVVVALGALGVPAGGDRRRGVAAALCGAAGLYIGAMVLSNALARRDALSAAELAGLTGVEAAMVAPVPADPLSGDVVIRTADGYVRGTHRWTRSPRVRLEPAAPVPLRAGAPGVTTGQVDGAIAAAARDPDARRYLVWSRFPYYRVVPDGGAAGAGYRVLISDVRYDGRGAGSLGGVEVRVSGSGAAP